MHFSFLSSLLSLKIQVVSFATEHNWDSLDFYDGADNHAPRLGSYSGNCYVFFNNLYSNKYIYYYNQGHIWFKIKLECVYQYRDVPLILAEQHAFWQFPCFFWKKNRETELLLWNLKYCSTVERIIIKHCMLSGCCEAYKMLAMWLHAKSAIRAELGAPSRSWVCTPTDTCLFICDSFKDIFCPQTNWSYYGLILH